VKTKVLIVVALFCSSVATSSFAWNHMDENNSNDDVKRGYESSFGNKYEYDLSRPGDRLRYDVDPAAQLRDSIDVNPTRELERGLRQYGGGVYRD
jgi:uncharacterized protein (DUF486 family)